MSQMNVRDMLKMMCCFIKEKIQQIGKRKFPTRKL